MQKICRKKNKNLRIKIIAKRKNPTKNHKNPLKR